MKKKKSTNLLPIAAGAALLIYYWKNLKGFISTSVVNIGKVAFNKIETGKQLYTKLVLDIYLEVSNPSTFSGSLKGVKLDLLVNNNNLGTITNTNTQILQPNGTTTIIVQGAVNALQLIGNIATVYKAIRDKKSITFRIVGDVYTSFGTNRIDVTKEVSLSDLI